MVGAPHQNGRGMVGSASSAFRPSSHMSSYNSTNNNAATGIHLQNVINYNNDNNNNGLTGNDGVDAGVLLSTIDAIRNKHEQQQLLLFLQAKTVDDLNNSGGTFWMKNDDVNSNGSSGGNNGSVVGQNGHDRVGPENFLAAVGGSSVTSTSLAVVSANDNNNNGDNGNCGVFRRFDTLSHNKEDNNYARHQQQQQQAQQMQRQQEKGAQQNSTYNSGYCCSSCQNQIVTVKSEVQSLKRMICEFMDVTRSIIATGINSPALAGHNPSNTAPINFVDHTISQSTTTGKIETNIRPSNAEHQTPLLAPQSLQQQPPTSVSSMSQPSAEALTKFQFNGINNNATQRLLPWLLTNGLISPNAAPLTATMTQQMTEQQQQPMFQQPQQQSQQHQQHQQVQSSVITSETLRLLEQLSPHLGDQQKTALIKSLQSLNNVSSGNSENTLNARLVEVLQTAIQRHHNQQQQLNKQQHQSQQQQSKVDSVNVDNSETSSSVSSTNTQMMMISPQQQQHQNGQTMSNGTQQLLSQAIAAAAGASGNRSDNFMSQLLSMPHITSTANTNSTANTSNLTVSFLQQQALLNNNATQKLNPQQQQQQVALAQIQASLLLQKQQEQQQRHQIQEHFKFQQQQQQQRLQIQQQQILRRNMSSNGPIQHNTSNNENAPNDGGGAGGPIVVSPERRRAASDDYVRSIRQENLSEDVIARINIPVLQAFQADPHFRPLTEQQVIQQVIQSKKYENVNVSETMAQLCKKLAEKRVFGSRLMSQTTVAAPNHSSYNNLPNQGIVYIQHVCRKVLGDKVQSEDEFWEFFREAMRKLAARCRRVRHAKKVRSPRINTPNSTPNRSGQPAVALSTAQAQPFRPLKFSTPISTSTNIASNENLSLDEKHRFLLDQQLTTSKPSESHFNPVTLAATVAALEAATRSNNCIMSNANSGFQGDKALINLVSNAAVAASAATARDVLVMDKLSDKRGHQLPKIETDALSLGGIAAQLGENSVAMTHSQDNEEPMDISGTSGCTSNETESLSSPSSPRMHTPLSSTSPSLARIATLTPPEKNDCN